MRKRSPFPSAGMSSLPRNSTEGDSRFDNGRVQVAFEHHQEGRHIQVNWPDFGGQSLSATIDLALTTDHESTVIVIPIGDRRFYYNRKVNCMPATGNIQVGTQTIDLKPDTCLGTLDWGRGVWDYNSFWVWASASGFLADGRTVGLNMGFGFGDTSAANENTLLLEGRIHKLGEVEFAYDNQDFKRPWMMTSPDGRVQAAIHALPGASGADESDGDSVGSAPDVRALSRERSSPMMAKPSPSKISLAGRKSTRLSGKCS